MRTALLFVVLAASRFLHGQAPTSIPLDTLLMYLDTARHDTIQVDLNTTVGWRYANSPLGVPYLERAIALCDELSASPDPMVRRFAAKRLPGALNLLALNCQRREDHLRAVALFRRAVEANEQVADTNGIILIENNLGLLFQKVGDGPNALVHYRRALSLAHRLRAQPMWPPALLARMGSVFVDMGQLDSAELYFSESLKDRVSTSLGFRYRNLALLREKQGRIADALALLDSSVAVSRMDRNYLILGTSYLHLAELLRGDDRPQQALTALDSCMAYFEEQEQAYYCQCLQAHGTLLADLGDPARAEEELIHAVAIARGTGQLRTQLLATGSLRDLYRRSGRLALALDMADEWHALNDSIGAMEAKSELLVMDFKRDQLTDSLTNARDREAERQVAATNLQRERTRRNVLLGFGAFALVFAVVDYRRRGRIKAEHARSEALLLNILPAEVATELKAKGHADAKHFDNATILFTDFKGFTQASERMSPQELVEELNTCFKAFDHIITARGIEKIKTIGDAYMCAGGLPDPKTSTPADVVYAALEMQAFMTSRKKERDARGLPAFEMRVGIHTGPVVAGIVGVKKFQYDIWGDTVNTASRMESSGEVGQVNISEATYTLVRNAVVGTQLSVVSGSSADSPATDNQHPTTAFTFTPRGKVQAKGKGEMEMYFVHQSYDGA